MSDITYLHDHRHIFLARSNPESTKTAALSFRSDTILESGDEKARPANTNARPANAITAAGISTLTGILRFLLVGTGLAPSV